MKKIILLSVLFSFFFRPVFAQEPASISEQVFKPGEHLSYRLKYGLFTAAVAELTVENTDRKYDGKPVYHIVVDSKTAGTFNVFYKVHNRYESYIDEKTLMPYFYTEDRHEAGYKHSDNVAFDHINNKITANKGTFPYKGKVFDFVSAYYFARSIDISRLKIGDKFDLQYFLEDGTHTLSVTYVGKEKMGCSMGTFNCLKFSPTIIPGRIFKKDSKLYLWITDDKNRIPVKANVGLIVGSVTMDLTGAKNLKYSLNPLKN